MVKTKSLNPSIVDFLNKQGLDSSYPARERLAKSYGVKNYRGHGKQNEELLELLRGEKSLAPLPSKKDVAESTKSLDDGKKTLPGETKSRLSSFSSVLSDAVGLAQKKRSRMMADIMGLATPGVGPASDFSGILGDFQRAGTSFTESLVKQALDQAEPPKIRSQVIEIGDKKVLVDLDTGEFIKDYGPGSAKTTDEDQDDKDYDWLDELISKNPDASREELLDEALRGTKLTKTEITAVLDKKETKETTLSDDALDRIAKQIFDSVRKLTKKRPEEFKDALFLIEKNAKKQKWSDVDVDKITSILRDKMGIKEEEK